MRYPLLGQLRNAKPGGGHSADTEGTAAGALAGAGGGFGQTGRMKGTVGNGVGSGRYGQIGRGRGGCGNVEKITFLTLVIPLHRTLPAPRTSPVGVKMRFLLML